MAVTLTLAEIVAIVGGLLVPGAASLLGAVFWVLGEMNRREAQRDSKRSELSRELHTRVDRIERDYLRRDDFDGHLQRIEKSLSELTLQVGRLVEMVARLQGPDLRQAPREGR